MTTMLLGFVLGVLGLAVTAVALLLILGPLRRPLFASIERAKVRRCLARRGRGDARLAARDVDGALREFAGAFCFVVPRADPGLTTDIARLHTGLLSRFVSIGDDLPGERVQFLALAKVERLLEQWNDMQRRRARGAPQTAELERHRRLTQQAIRELVSELRARRQGPLLH
jgi:hypothetical protein